MFKKVHNINNPQKLIPAKKPLNGQNAKINTREMQFFSKKTKLRKLVPAKISTIKVSIKIYFWRFDIFSWGYPTFSSGILPSILERFYHLFEPLCCLVMLSGIWLVTSIVTGSNYNNQLLHIQQSHNTSVLELSKCLKLLH